MLVLQRVRIVFNRLKVYSLNRKAHTENCKASNVRLLATSIRIVWTNPREMGREKDSGEEGLGKEWILWRRREGKSERGGLITTSGSYLEQEREENS